MTSVMTHTDRLGGTAIEPDLYQLTGAHLHVTYATAGINGRGSFSYHDAQRGLHFAGDEIRVEETAVGSLVTVPLHITEHAGGTTFTLLLPHVTLSAAQSLPIQAQGITTVHRRLPAGVIDHGQAELHTVVGLTGTASGARH